MRIACCVALAIILGTADRVWACSCFEFSSCSLYAAADAVFLGEVVDARVENRQLVARMRVTRVWKGTVDRLVTVSNPADSSCSFPFTVGTRYVVYGGGTGGAFVTWVCAGGGQLRPGEQEPDLPPVSGSVTCTVARYKKVIVDRDTDDRIPGGRPKLHAIPLDHDWTRHDLTRVRNATSGQNGAFEFKGIPPGQYVLGVNVFASAIERGES